MAKIQKQRTGINGDIITWRFECPGCKCSHLIWTAPPHPGGPKWIFNGDIDKPTFSPSLLIGWNYGDKQFRCHSFIKDGMIQFLSDCTHELAGKTVDMIEIIDNTEDNKSNSN